MCYKVNEHLIREHEMVGMESFLELDIGIEPDIIKHIINTFNRLDLESQDIDSSDQLKVMLSELQLANHELVTEKEMDSIHLFGFQAFEHERYDDAISIYQLLHMLDPLHDGYLFGLGLSLEQNNQFEKAASAFYLGYMIHPDNLEWSYRAGICYQKQGMYDLAVLMFQYTIENQSNDVEFQVFKDRSRLFINTMKVENNN